MGFLGKLKSTDREDSSGVRMWVFLSAGLLQSLFVQGCSMILQFTSPYYSLDKMSWATSRDVHKHRLYSMRTISCVVSANTSSHHHLPPKIGREFDL